MKPLKASSVYLTNGSKNICWYCKKPFEKRVHSFAMKGTKPNTNKLIEEPVLYCSECNTYFVTQEICKNLAHKYPNFFVDVAQYNLKVKKRKQPNNTPGSETDKGLGSIPQDRDDVGTKQDASLNVSLSDNSMGLNAPVLLSNTYGIAHKVCPTCSSVLRFEKVNIPVVYENGDFYRFYTSQILFCNNCNRGYIDKNTVNSILHKLQQNDESKTTLKLDNVTIKRNSHSREFLYCPTLNNSTCIFSPVQDYTLPHHQSTDELVLNSESFLHKMGYNVSEHEVNRHRILSMAVCQYGKRKVSDHLSFLIDMRRNQVGGATKYAHALDIWQRDLNYIFNLK